MSNKKMFLATTTSIDPIVLEFSNETATQQDEFSITYNVRMADGEDLPSNITPASVYGKTQTATIYGGSYSFDVLIPFLYTARVYRYLDSDNSVLELTGSRSDIDDETERERQKVNDGYPLGTEPIYSAVNTVDTTRGPLEYRRTATFLEEEIYESRTIVVELAPRTEPVYFDAHLPLNTANLSNRGSSGTLNQFGGTLWPNILTEDSWGWNSTNGCFKNAPSTLSGSLLNLYKTHWYYDEDTESYSLDWVFQTNSGTYMLNSWKINGVNIPPPFIPEELWEGNTLLESYGEGADGTYTEVVIEEAELKLRKVRSFNKNTQHVFYFTIRNAHSNMTLTYGNLMQYGDGSPELSFNEIQGVSCDGVEKNTFQLYYGNEWHDHTPGYLHQMSIYGDISGDPKTYYANLKFKVMYGYENPVFTNKSLVQNLITDSNRNDVGEYDREKTIPWDDVDNNLEDSMLKRNFLYGPDQDGYYYARLYDKPDNNAKLYDCSIVASSVKYVIRYMVGNVNDKLTNPPGNMKGTVFVPAEVIDMPAFDPKRNAWDDFRSKLDYIDDHRIERYDDNNGKFYDTLVYPNIVIANNVPTDPSGDKVFEKWVIVDSNEIPVLEDATTIDFYPNTVLRLENYVSHSHLLDSELGGLENSYFVLRIKGVWNNK